MTTSYKMILDVRAVLGYGVKTSRLQLRRNLGVDPLLLAKLSA
jgi:hypothetical protein